MLEPVTRQYKDLSTSDNFAFAFYCDRCGKEWQSEVYQLDLKGFEPPVDKRIRAMIWEQQHNEAYERANREAGARFNRCPTCGCRICDDCLYSTTLGNDDKCLDCADRDNEPDDN